MVTDIEPSVAEYIAILSVQIPPLRFAEAAAEGGFHILENFVAKFTNLSLLTIESVQLTLVQIVRQLALIDLITLNIGGSYTTRRLPAARAQLSDRQRGGQEVGREEKHSPE